MDVRAWLDTYGPVWNRVLTRYNSCSITTDDRWKRIPVQEAPWCPAYDGLFAAEVPITDVWRLIASFNLHYTNSTNEANTPTEIHICDLWVSVPDALLGKPLVHMDFRPGTSFPGYDTPLIPRTLQTRFAAGWVWHMKSAVPVGRSIRAKHPAGKELGCPVPPHSQSALSKLDVIFQSKPRRRKQGRSPCRKSATTCGIMLTLSIALGDGTPIQILLERAMINVWDGHCLA